MGKLSEEVKALRSKERADKKIAKKKKDREIISVIKFQKKRRKLKKRNKR